MNINEYKLRKFMSTVLMVILYFFTFLLEIIIGMMIFLVIVEPNFTLFNISFISIFAKIVGIALLLAGGIFMLWSVNNVRILQKQSFSNNKVIQKDIVEYNVAEGGKALMYYRYGWVSVIVVFFLLRIFNVAYADFILTGFALASTAIAFVLERKLIAKGAIKFNSNEKVRNRMIYIALIVYAVSTLILALAKL